MITKIITTINLMLTIGIICLAFYGYSYVKGEIAKLTSFKVFAQEELKDSREQVENAVGKIENWKSGIEQRLKLLKKSGDAGEMGDIGPEENQVEQ